MKLHQVDLVAEYFELKTEIDRAVHRVLKSGAFILGGEASKFEEAMSRYLGVKNSVGVGNGTDALQIAYMALDLNPGDEVITTPFTFIATVEPMVLLKLRPVFVDIDPLTFNLDPKKIEEKITERTRAIAPVHLYGQCADMDPLLEIARKHNLYVIEDAAQAIGATYKDKKAGTIGTLGTFSFYPTKNLGAYGDGGLIVADNQEIAKKLRILRVHGSYKKYEHSVIGVNSRLDSIQAAILSVKLKYLDRWNERRRAIAQIYNEHLSNVAGLKTPKEADLCYHIYHQFTIQHDSRDELQKFLTEQGVGCGIHYPKPLHLQKALAFLGHSEGEFPNAEKAAKNALSLPIYPQLSDQEAAAVSDLIRNFYIK
ncbi:MAG: hypothetical protein B6244_00995 [Candidatus Cloacimonetes bacterium 4572_55]|nr:MAG: hypothetical protein B6244_00995 [Candidatus Cloacimonetes bacterium 4572_55]